jgi:hypothetical protein
VWIYPFFESFRECCFQGFITKFVAKRLIKQLAKFCVALGVSNIRVIKKIERLVDAVSPLLKKFHARVSGQAIQTLTLLGWAYYSKAEKADDGTTLLEFVVKKHGKALYGTTAHKDLSEKEKLWYSMLGTYYFSPVDDFDLVLLDGIKSGFFDEKKLIDKATTLNKRFSSCPDGLRGSLGQVSRHF